MISYNAYNQYKENSIFTANPEELTFMLYNGLIKFIMRGMDAVQKKNMQDAHDNMIRAQEIVSEFMRTLDKQYTLSSSLELIYDYMLRRLVEANTHKSFDILNEVLDFAKQLRDTWEQAMKLAKQQPKKAIYVEQASV